jgi:hypothetical protein
MIDLRMRFDDMQPPFADVTREIGDETVASGHHDS